MRKGKWDHGPRPCIACGELYRRRRAREEEWPGTKPYGSGTECQPCARTRVRRNVRPVSDEMFALAMKALGMDKGEH